jgi:hypothetical protein
MKNLLANGASNNIAVFCEPAAKINFSDYPFYVRLPNQIASSTFIFTVANSFIIYTQLFSKDSQLSTDVFEQVLGTPATVLSLFNH